MRLTFQLRRSYGRDRFYPTNEAARLLVEELSERQCFEERDLRILQNAGALVQVRALPDEKKPATKSSKEVVK